MKGIVSIYTNDHGMSFYWKAGKQFYIHKVQLVFKETGFYFTMSELQYFKTLIAESFLKNNCCEDCKIRQRCVKFLLKTPCSQIDLAVSIQELEAISDLVEGTLFAIQIKEYVYGTGMN